MLILARKIHERIIIGDDIEVSVVDIKGDQVKLGIRAPRNVKVYRQEVYEAIQRENRMAAQRASDTLPSLDGLLDSREDSQDESVRQPEESSEDNPSSADDENE